MRHNNKCSAMSSGAVERGDFYNFVNYYLTLRDLLSSKTCPLVLYRDGVR